jgi:putative colanic acid biosysnthesis UDP-glucose lipid carrier transferase
MPGFYNKLVKPIHFLGDIFIINAAFVACCYYFIKQYEVYQASQFARLQIVVNLAWVVSILILQTYKLYRVQTIVSIVNNTLRVLVLYYIIIEASDGLLTTVHHSGVFVYVFYASTGLVIIVWRLIATIILRRYRAKGYNYRRIVVIGMNKATTDMIEFFSTQSYLGYKLCRVFDMEKYNYHFEGLLGELKTYCTEQQIDEIYYSFSEFNFKQLEPLIAFAEQQVMRLKFIPHASGIHITNFKIDFYGFLPVYILREIPLDEFLNKRVKRIFDILFSILLIVFIFSWLFPIIAIAIKLNSKGSVFFKQKRSGLNNDDFDCYKFRSMQVNNEQDALQAMKGDSRITAVGSFLRKTSLDELPQFLNVLIGNMSVVGPRPHMLKHTEEYSKMIDKYMVRHFIKPGITGLAQIKGFRGETSDPAMMERRIKMDIFYLENWSFLLDMRIIFSTVWNVFKGDKNAY